MAENRRGRDRRYYFTLGQMVLLGTAFTLTALVIFVLGIFIGKGIEARKMVRPQEPLIRIPVKPSAQGPAGLAGAAPREELTFYDTLTKSPQERPTTEQKSNKIKALAMPLKGDAKETVPQDAKASEKTVKAEFKDTQTDAKANGGASAQKLANNKAEKPMPSAGVTKATPAAEDVGQKEGGKTWSVQLNAFPDERSAKQLVDRLKNKGYNAVISEARNKGRVWYRVRVGKYNSRDEADKALENFKTRENFDKAFATSRQQ